MPHTIRIEGSAVSVEAEPGDTILDALLMAGVGFSYSCQAGNCGTCRCELVSGDVLELEHSEHALAPEERARGVVLACRTQVWGDAVIRKLDDEEFVVHPSRIMRCEVAGIDRLTHDIWQLRLGVLAGGPFSFSPGQYASVEFPFAPGRPRDYSMANRPDDPQLEFHVREMPGGSVSGGIGKNLRHGDAVRVSGPFGSSYLRTNHSGPVIAIAGGSGLAPVRSILSTLRSQGLDNPVHVYFGARAERDVYAEAEMRSWVDHWPGSSGHVVLSAPGAAASAASRRRRFGLVTDAVAADFETLDGYKAYVAGPPAMVEAATALLVARGLPIRDIHADAFHPATDVNRKELTA
jgi:ferredoxin-NAD(P)+ reductase (naphthalene dioxygenase ferredoxin-specific)